MSLYENGQRFDNKCEELLAQINRLDSEIAAAATDKKHVQKLRRDKADQHRKFASHLYDSNFDLVDPSGYFIDFSYRIGDRFVEALLAGRRCAVQKQAGRSARLDDGTRDRMERHRAIATR